MAPVGRALARGARATAVAVLAGVLASTVLVVILVVVPPGGGGAAASELPPSAAPRARVGMGTAGRHVATVSAAGPPPEPSTTVRGSTTTTIAPLGNLPVAGTTPPLVTKAQSAHVSGVFAIASIAGFSFVLVLMAIQAVLTRPARRRRGARTL
jgi:hypothetical protein